VCVQWPVSQLIRLQGLLKGCCLPATTTTATTTTTVTPQTWPRLGFHCGWRIRGDGLGPGLLDLPAPSPICMFFFFIIPFGRQTTTLQQPLQPDQLTYWPLHTHTPSPRVTPFSTTHRKATRVVFVHACPRVHYGLMSLKVWLTLRRCLLCC